MVWGRKQRNTLTKHRHVAVPRPDRAKSIPPGVWERMIQQGLAEERVIGGVIRIELTPTGRAELQRLEARQKPTPQGQRFIRSLIPLLPR